MHWTRSGTTARPWPGWWGRTEYLVARRKPRTEEQIAQDLADRHRRRNTEAATLAWWQAHWDIPVGTEVGYSPLASRPPELRLRAGEFCTVQQMPPRFRRQGIALVRFADGTIAAARHRELLT